MKFTVLVISYNSKLSQLYLTLQSVLWQRFDDFELVIADDGSSENHFAELEKFFQKNQFTHYKLIANHENRGTVQNILSGLRHTEGKYVKLISAGDALYDENTLQKIWDFMEKEQCEGCFGLLQGYQWEEEKRIRKVGYFHPLDIKAYRSRDHRRIVKNLVLYSDNVCGAAICYKTGFALEYMERIQAQVLYEEDIFQVLAAVEGRELRLFDAYMIWYEIGTGMSTKKNSGFETRMRRDEESFYKELYRQYGEHPNVKKRFRLMKFYKIHNLYLRTFFRFFANPDSLRYVLVSMVQRKRGAHKQKTDTAGFLEQEDFLEKL